MLRPDISVITATQLSPARRAYLVDLYNDLRAQTLTSWEWVLSVDGATDDVVPASIAGDPRVTVLRVGRGVGAAAARNLALGVADGIFVTSCDDDDRLPETSLEVRLRAIRTGGAAWSAGLLADDRDGEESVWQCPAPRGFCRSGDVWRSWSSPDATFPLGPTTLLVERDLLRAVGGWQGLPQGEDFGMVVAVTSVAPGVMLDDVVYVYRKHEGQMMRSENFNDLEPLVRTITHERGRLLVEQPESTR
jgi:glycosyltransferase involved in cell wall biosynthesis